jgi:SAM-dependent methyltransferase
MSEADFDVSGVFNDDYLWFYEQSLTDERNRSEVDEIVTTLNLSGQMSILDAPCGHGRLSNLLAAEGHTVTGVDITPLFLDRAKADAMSADVEVDYRLGDLRQLPVDGPFDIVICWFTSFGYFDDPDNQATLSEFARVLRPGGKLLIETMNHDGFVRSHTPAPAATVARRGDDLMVDVAVFDPISGRLETDRTVTRDGLVRRTNYSVRLPTVPEFDRWLEAAGFGHRTYNDRQGAALRCESWRLVVVATKSPE